VVDPRERVIRVPPRTTLSVVLVALSVIGLLVIVWTARQVLTWILIALFLALAINPYVEFLQRRVVRRRLLATLIGFGTVLVAIAGLAAAFVPTIAGEVGDFVDALPGYVSDVTEGRGRLGFLETRYHIVERVQDAVKGLKPESVLAASGTALSVTKGVITAVVGAVTIVVLTFFMLLEGPGWIDRALGHLPSGSRERWQGIARDVYRTVGGYVSGALIIAFVAGVSATIVLGIAGVPYAFALGLLTALLDLVPLAGATVAAILVSAVAFLHSVPAGIAVVVFFVLYQQFENHVLYPTVYSRTVALSPLAVLIAVLIGASLAGILGAIAAIPVAGTVQVLLRDWLASRRGVPPGPPAPASEP
jgi:predicted PurR-regulated permease PerM